MPFLPLYKPLSPTSRWAVLSAFVTVLIAFSGPAGTISGSFSPIASGSNVDLTVAGKSDWVHWGLYTETTVNRKWGIPKQISDFSIVATPGTTVVAYQFGDNANGYSWQDGWPSRAATNTTTGVWAYQAFPLNPTSTGFGFQLVLPADTTLRHLQVFVGAFKARGQLRATLSDGGPPYTDTSLFNEANGPGGVYSLDFKANSPNQTLTVQWTLYARATLSNSADANVTLQAAALTVANANNPPLATFLEPLDQSAFAAPGNVTLSAAARDFDGMVTNVTFEADGIVLGEQASSPYSFTWNAPPPGRHMLVAIAKDNGGAARASVPLEILVYGTGGNLTGSGSFPPGFVDLTSEGTADWVHWGLATNEVVDRKDGITPLISDLEVLGTAPPQRFADNYTAFGWTDGSPTAAVPGTTTGLFIPGLTNGFSLGLPADLTTRHVRIYVGAYGVQGNFQAWLTDFSAAPFIDNSVSSQYGNAYAVFDLDYAAASSGEQLRVVFRSRELFDWDYGNVTIQAVALAGAATPPPLRISDARLAAAAFLLSFPTRTGYTYTVESTDFLPAPTWNFVTNVSGTGDTVTITNLASLPNGRFFRVREQ